MVGRHLSVESFSGSVLLPRFSASATGAGGRHPVSTSFSSDAVLGRITSEIFLVTSKKYDVLIFLKKNKTILCGLMSLSIWNWSLILLLSFYGVVGCFDLRVSGLDLI